MKAVDHFAPRSIGEVFHICSTAQEIAYEIGFSKEEVVYALDAIQTPMSLQEPVYSGGDILHVMDQ